MNVNANVTISLGPLRLTLNFKKLLKLLTVKIKE